MTKVYVIIDQMIDEGYDLYAVCSTYEIAEKVNLKFSANIIEMELDEYEKCTRPDVFGWRVSMCRDGSDIYCRPDYAVSTVESYNISAQHPICNPTYISMSTFADNELDAISKVDAIRLSCIESGEWVEDKPRKTLKELGIDD